MVRRSYTATAGRSTALILSPPSGLSHSYTRVIKGSKGKKGIYKSISEPYINTGISAFRSLSQPSKFSLVAPAAAWTAGYIAAGQSAPSVQSKSIPWCTPRESVGLNTAWAIKKTTKTEIGPGRTHEHKVGATFRRMFDTDKTTLYQALKGLTHGILYVHKDQVCDDFVIFGCISTPKSGK